MKGIYNTCAKHTQINKQASVARILFAGFFGIFSNSVNKVLLDAQITEVETRVHLIFEQKKRIAQLHLNKFCWTRKLCKFFTQFSQIFKFDNLNWYSYQAFRVIFYWVVMHCGKLCITIENFGEKISSLSFESLCCPRKSAPGSFMLKKLGIRL